MGRATVKISEFDAGRTKGAEITLGGDCSIINVETIFEQMVDTTKKYSIITITSKEIENIDTSFIQSLAMLANMYKKTGTKINFNLSLKDEMKKMFENVGFADFVA